MKRNSARLYLKHQQVSTQARETPTVLIVEDDQAIICLLRDVLECEGIDVLTAYDGYAALTLTLNTQPDLILTDLMLPRMDGSTLREQLLNHPQTAHIPVLLMTAAYQPRLNSKFTAVITKPFSIDMLMQQIRHYLG